MKNQAPSVAVEPIPDEIRQMGPPPILATDDVNPPEESCEFNQVITFAESQHRQGLAEHTQMLSVDIVKQIADLFGPPLLLPSEDPSQHTALVQYFAAAARPLDAFSLVFINDLVDHRMTIARYKRIGLLLTQHSQPRVGRSIVGHPMEATIRAAEKAIVVEGLIERGFKRYSPELEYEAQQELEREENQKHKEAMEAERLAHQKTPIPAIKIPENFDLWASQQEQINRMIQSVEDRYYKTLDQLARYLGGLSKVFQNGLQDVIDAEIIAPSLANEINSARPAATSAKSAGYTGLGKGSPVAEKSKAMVRQEAPPRGHHRSGHHASGRRA